MHVCAQLGDGSNTDRYTPPSSDVLTGVAAITAGFYHTCALTTAGGVRCWGFNVQGQARHRFHTYAVFVSVCMLCEGYGAHTRNRAKCMCSAFLLIWNHYALFDACVIV